MLGSTPYSKEIFVVSFIDIIVFVLFLGVSMNAMKYRGYTARIDYDGVDNIFVGLVVGLSEQLTFHGGSVEELRGDFEFAIDHYLAACEAAGIAPERQASGRLLVRMPAEVHVGAIVAAAAAGISLNEWIVKSLSTALNAKQAA
jgi:predicted HicB family RNase H-like nuclease